MAILLDRSYGFRTIGDYFLGDVAEKGRFLVYGIGGGSGAGSSAGGGSGVTYDQTAAAVSVAGNPSGLVCVGMLLNNQVSRDLTRDHLNFHRDEMIVGGKCLVTREGRFYTNLYTGTPSVGNRAYLTSHGRLTPTNGGAAATPPVGEFISAPDENGFVGIEIKLP